MAFGSGVIGKLLEASKEYKALFYSSMEKDEAGMAAAVARLSMEMPSRGSETTYRHMGSPPAFKEKQGSALFERLREYAYTLVNKDYEAGCVVKVQDIEDDMQALYYPLIRDMGAGLPLFKYLQIVELIKNGGASLCYDGKNFFDTTHVEGDSGSQSNSLNLALSETNLGKAIAAQQELKDDRGRVLMIVPDTLVVCSELLVTAKKLVQKPLTTAGESTAFQGDLDLMVLAGTGSTTFWGTTCLKRSTKPFIVQKRKDASFTAKDKADDDCVFYDSEAHYKAAWRGAFGYGMWQYFMRGKA